MLLHLAGAPFLLPAALPAAAAAAAVLAVVAEGEG